MWSDLKIKCKDRTWKVHRLVVGLQSKPLGAALNGEFKVRDFLSRSSNTHSFSSSWNILCNPLC
jgi:hypothetical protein